MTATDTTAHDDTQHDHGLSDLGYVKIAIALAIVTAIEVALSYTQDQLGALFLPLLLILMGVKFFSVVLYFMHLKFDKPILTWVFYAGLTLAVLVYLAVLSMFRIWVPGEHG